MLWIKYQTDMNWKTRFSKLNIQETTLDALKTCNYEFRFCFGYVMTSISDASVSASI